MHFSFFFFTLSEMLREFWTGIGDKDLFIIDFFFKQS